MGLSILKISKFKLKKEVHFYTPFSIFIKMNDYKTLYKNILHEYEQLSKCDRMKVACLLVEKGRIISCGYNGTPSGQCNCNELFKHTDNYRTFFLRKSIKSKWKECDENTWKKSHHEFSLENEIHAEQSALGYALKWHMDISGAAIVISYEPCEACARLIYASGINHVMYVNKYDRGSRGLEFLEKNGVKVEQI